ncbi:MAG: hypothetical protein KDI32_07215 [Pseudomonadales bacterium]|nr:hypothetical protein [Pseudomonadales bacterium]
MQESTLQPFSLGDLFVAVTELNDPNDDHAGRGRIIQYDVAGHQKGLLYLRDTTHLVGGLKFDPRGVLWAFDSQEFVVLNIHPDGKVVRRSEFPRRPFSHVNFAPDGTLYLGEHVVGSTVKPEIAARMHTKLPFMPGTDRFGDGHVWHFKSDGKLIKEYATQTHGGMGGFLGVTMSTLSADGKTLVYCSETGPRLMRYDLANDKQLPDLQSFQPPFQGPPAMFFAMEYAPNGMLYVLRGGRVEVVDDSGATKREIALPGFGWAIMDITTDGRYGYVGNYFSGDVLKIELASGAQLGTIKTGGAKALAGVVEYQGEGTRAARAQIVSKRTNAPIAPQPAVPPSSKRKPSRKTAARKKVVKKKPAQKRAATKSAVRKSAVKKSAAKKKSVTKRAKAAARTRAKSKRPSGKRRVVRRKK